MRFNEWLGKIADFGFETERSRKKEPCSDNMSKTINSENVMFELNRLPPIGPIKGQLNIFDVMEWGNQVGAIRLNVSPYGSYKALVKRKIKDLLGEDRWICKHVFPLNSQEILSMNETAIAHRFYDTVKEISTSNIERATSECPFFEKMCWGILGKCKVRHPEIMFPVGMKKIAENHFTIFFEFRGQGVEAPNSKRIEQFNIDMSFDPNTGMIRSNGYEITSPTNHHKWEPAPSEWDEYFAPTQDKNEIINCVNYLLRTY